MTLAQVRLMSGIPPLATSLSHHPSVPNLEQVHPVRSALSARTARTAVNARRRLSATLCVMTAVSLQMMANAMMEDRKHSGSAPSAATAETAAHASEVRAASTVCRSFAARGARLPATATATTAAQGPSTTAARSAATAATAPSGRRRVARSGPNLATIPTRNRHHRPRLRRASEEPARLNASTGGATSGTQPPTAGAAIARAATFACTRNRFRRRHAGCRSHHHHPRRRLRSSSRARSSKAARMCE